MTYTCKAPGRRREGCGQKGAAGRHRGRPGPGRRARRAPAALLAALGQRTHNLHGPTKDRKYPKKPSGGTGGMAPPDVKVRGKGAGMGAPGAARSSAGPGRRRGRSREPAPAVVAPGGARAARGWASGGGAAAPAGARKQRGLAGSRPRTPEAGNVGSSPQGKAWDRNGSWRQ